MLTSYLKTSLRNIGRHKGYSLLNIFSLAIGVTCFTIIFSYVNYQASFDAYNKKLDRIYRLTTEYRFSPNSPPVGYAWVQARAASLLQSESPQISQVCRLIPLWDCYVLRGSMRFIDKGIALSDSTIFRVFTFHLIAGDKRTALSEPQSAVLTKNASLRYFRTVNSIGKTFTIDNGGKLIPFMVSGVMKNVPLNSHFGFDMLIPFENAREILGGQDSVNCYTYLLLKKQDSEVSFQRELPTLAHEYSGDMPGGKFKFVLQRLRAIHLHSHLRFEWEPNMDMQSIDILSLIGILVLIVAGANFTSISIAQYLNRAREIGVRKAIGATRLPLVVQLLVESTMIAFVGTLVGITIAEIAMPAFRNIAGENVISRFIGVGPILSVVTVGVLAGIISGIYPAFYLSSFSASSALRNLTVSAHSKLNLRKALVIFQFIVSIGLITGTVVIEKQFNFMVNKDLGFDKSAVIMISIQSEDEYMRLKTALTEKPGIVGVGAAMYEPGQSMGSVMTVDPVSRRSFQMRWNSIDGGFLRTLEMKIIDGEIFSKQVPTTLHGFMLNQAAVGVLGWKAAVGRELIAGRDTGLVVGVLKDVYFSSMRDKISPTIYWYKPSMFYNMLVRIRPSNYTGSIAQIRSVWNQIVPDAPFEFNFLDQDLNNLYRSEEQLGSLIALFAGLAIVVGCLGLYGLVSFTAKQRTKEIGIRKVLGASLTQIVSMFLRDFSWLIVIANFVAWPITYYAMTKWLENFAYRTPINPWVLILAAASIFLIAVITIIISAIKAALANPAKSLQYQ